MRQCIVLALLLTIGVFAWFWWDNRADFGEYYPLLVFRYGRLLTGAFFLIVAEITGFLYLAFQSTLFRQSGRKLQHVDHELKNGTGVTTEFAERLPK